jgi:hypothetical protein
MEEGTNLLMAFVLNCTALVLSVESEERKLSMPPTHKHLSTDKASKQFQWKYAIKKGE